jgi:hypothetical protein
VRASAAAKPSRIETNLRRSLRFGALVQPLITVQFKDHKKFSVATPRSNYPMRGAEAQT